MWQIYVDIDIICNTVKSRCFSSVEILISACICQCRILIDAKLLILLLLLLVPVFVSLDCFATIRLVWVFKGELWRTAAAFIHNQMSILSPDQQCQRSEGSLLLKCWLLSKMQLICTYWITLSFRNTKVLHRSFTPNNWFNT